MRERGLRVILWSVLGALFGLGSLCFAQEVPGVEFEKFTLANGLQVILHEDHSAPLVSVNVWYHVGSKDEEPGRTGFAHLFEHLMFEGSKNVPEGMFDTWLESVGGDNNGSTTEDRTNYYENLPSNALEVALYLESDRMAHLLDAVDQKKLDTQRDVVKNERRQGLDNQPYGRAFELAVESLYPSDHPYSWSVIGSMDDLSAASLDDVRAFFQKFYVPNNASLCIAGDIDPVKTRELVEKYFGSIPPGQPIQRLQSWLPALSGVKRVQMKDNVSLPRVYMAWHTPALYQPGDAEMDLLASILADGKNSRLYRRLVYEDQIAQDVSAFQDSKEVSSTFYIISTAKPGVSLEQIESAIEEELALLLRDGPTEQELDAARNGWEATFVRSLQAVGGFRGKANLLNQYNTFAGRPDYFESDMRRYFDATPQSVRTASNEFIDPGRRLILSVEPAGNLKAEETAALDRSSKPETGPAPSLELPPVKKISLSNGLRVLLVEQDEVPLVQLNLLFDGGWSADPEGKPGVSSLTSELQDEGTTSRSALEIADELKEIGALLSTDSTFDGSTVRLNTLKKQFSRSMEIFADVVMNPSFPQKELERKQKEYLGRLLQEEQQPFTVALKSFQKLLYGEGHPYSQPYTGTGTSESVSSITREDLEQYFDSYFHPANATLIVVGDIAEGELVSELERVFEEWKPKAKAEFSVPMIQPLEQTQVYVIDKPGAAQSVLIAGNLGMMRNSPEYYAGHVMNTVLGGKFTSRLNMNLREDKGYTYGARSQFLYLKGRGPFFAYTEVQTEVTGESIIELLREFDGIAGEALLSEKELEETKDYISLRYPRGFETISQLAGKLVEMVTYDLPEASFNNFVPSIATVTGEEVLSAAGQYVNSGQMLWVIVGDASKIGTAVEELKLGDVKYLDVKGEVIQR